MKKILILEANPKNDLSLNDEIRDLQSVIESSRDREEFKIDIGLSVRSIDLHDLMQKYEPNIVHFCGHGTGQDGLVFKDKNIDTDTISSLFALCREHLQCVVLNACYSEVQANEINKNIKYVIGMKQAIRDDAAIAFSIGFYRALGYGKSFEDAFKWGKNAIQLAIGSDSINRAAIAEEMRKLVPIGEVSENINLQEHLKPVLMINSNLPVSQTPIVINPILQIQINELKKDIELLTDNYLLTTKKARSYNTPADKNNLEQQAQDLIEQINNKQKELEALKK